MQFKTKIVYSWVISTTILVISMILPVIPCQTGANVPNPTYTWSMCRLNPDLMALTNLKTYFLGYTPSMIEGYFIVLILSFLISFGLMHLFTKKKAK